MIRNTSTTATQVPPQGDRKGTPICTNLSKDEFVLRRAKTSAEDVGSCSSWGTRLISRPSVHDSCCFRSVCVDPLACTGRICTAAAATPPLLPLSGQAVEDSRPLRAWLPSEGWCLCTAPACVSAPAQPLELPRLHQLKAHSTAWRASSCAELGRLPRMFIWHPERMRRSISAKAEQMLP